jgi:RES domain-containing protein
MISVWRLVKKRYQASAFTGEGARRFGGRWNHAGTSVVYVSDSISLAALEAFVHLGRAGAHLEFVVIEVRIPKSVGIEELATKNLPRQWRRQPPTGSTKDVGTEWVNRGSSAVLRVPSVIVPRQHNYLLSRAHPEYAKLKIMRVEPFSFDPRMWK